jgi:hypothetical protein
MEIKNALTRFIVYVLIPAATKAYCTVPDAADLKKSLTVQVG